VCLSVCLSVPLCGVGAGQGFGPRIQQHFDVCVFDCVCVGVRWCVCVSVVCVCVGLGPQIEER